MEGEGIKLILAAIGSIVLFKLVCDAVCVLGRRLHALWRTRTRR